MVRWYILGQSVTNEVTGNCGWWFAGTYWTSQLLMKSRETVDGLLVHTGPVSY